MAAQLSIDNLKRHWKTRHKMFDMGLTVTVEVTSKIGESPSTIDNNWWITCNYQSSIIIVNFWRIDGKYSTKKIGLVLKNNYENKDILTWVIVDWEEQWLLIIVVILRTLVKRRWFLFTILIFHDTIFFLFFLFFLNIGTKIQYQFLIFLVNY